MRWSPSGDGCPDEGQVAVDRGVTIGYFSQDVGEMSGRSAVSEVMDGAGPVNAVAIELKELAAAMGNSDRADDMENIVERYGEVQGRFATAAGTKVMAQIAAPVSAMSTVIAIGVNILPSTPVSVRIGR